MPDVDIPLVDKWVHFLIFGGFSFLWLCMVQKSDIKSYSLIFLISVLFGYGVELLQDSGITRGRSFDAYDVIADGIGGVIGILLFNFLQKAYGLRK